MTWKKHIIMTILTISLYEITKYTLEQVLICMQANDDIDKPPIDFDAQSQNDLEHIGKMKKNHARNT
ncbi:transcriptional regulator [Staphylococcus pettenkoferi]|uniref:Transcriptional regulator n=1 Tax=Staphylococcus pettenkoferi TaxID=170573 RepID=A0ABT4BKX2_9STAP|nr:transcriptional regulator [Staphylococcus pettenkoferi]MCY1563843.1 transcriptional regulator [Staphylococcus pettenkoferi]MCY1583326.1 transcriptional regulator [Staphylococcus pettenkoferi]